jgi:hypothetical protein
MIALGLLIVWRLPNPYQWLRGHRLTCDPVSTSVAPTRPLQRYELWCIGAVLGLSILALTRTGEFLYFQF